MFGPDQQAPPPAAPPVQRRARGRRPGPAPKPAPQPVSKPPSTPPKPPTQDPKPTSGGPHINPPTFGIVSCINDALPNYYTYCPILGTCHSFATPFPPGSTGPSTHL